MTKDAPQIAPFSVGLTGNYVGSDGKLQSGYGLEALEEARLPWGVVDPDRSRGLTARQLGSHTAFLMGPALATAEAIEAADPAPLLLARFGIGTDTIDMEACTRLDVIVSITPDGAGRPVAVAALTHILASTLNLYAKDAMVRTGEWGKDRARWQGRGLVGRTVGLVGLGNIGGIVSTLVRPLLPNIIAYDPYRKPEDAAKLGVELVSLDDLLARSDVVVVVCALTPETHHLIGARELARMKPTASLVNVARGPIVDHEALVEALERGVIAGAGLDVFEQEPLPANDPLTRMSNVMLSPHGLCMTDEWAFGCGSSAVQAILAVRAGEAPKFVANPAVLERPSLQARLRALRS